MLNSCVHNNTAWGNVKTFWLSVHVEHTRQIMNEMFIYHGTFQELASFLLLHYYHHHIVRLIPVLSGWSLFLISEWYTFPGLLHALPIMYTHMIVENGAYFSQLGYMQSLDPMDRCQEHTTIISLSWSFHQRVLLISMRDSFNLPVTYAYTCLIPWVTDD